MLKPIVIRINQREQCLYAVLLYALHPLLQVH